MSEPNRDFSNWIWRNIHIDDMNRAIITTRVRGYEDIVAKQEAREASARAIMEKFVFKVDEGRAISTETYAEMKEWLDD